MNRVHNVDQFSFVEPNNNEKIVLTYQVFKYRVFRTEATYTHDDQVIIVMKDDRSKEMILAETLPYKSEEDLREYLTKQLYWMSENCVV